MLQLFGPVEKYEIYMTVKARQYHNAPYGGCLYLRLKDPNAKNQMKMLFCSKPHEDKEFLDNTSKGRKLWLGAIALAKHGRTLLESYRNYLEQQFEYHGKLGKDVVAMDYSKGRAEIIYDAFKIEEIRRQSRQRSRDRFQWNRSYPVDALEHGDHLTQKYFHGALSRWDAENLLAKRPKNGSWLLRESDSRIGALTLSYVSENKICHRHVYAAPYYDPSSLKQLFVVTTDNNLAFYDVQSLLDYYRLNKTDTLGCMLGVSVKKKSQRDDSPPRNVISPRPPGMSKSDKSPRSMPEAVSQSLQWLLKPKKLSVDPSPSVPASSASKSSPIDPSSSGVSVSATPDTTPSAPDSPTHSSSKA